MNITQIKAHIRENIPFIDDIRIARLLKQSRKESLRIHSMSDEELENHVADMYFRYTGRRLDWNNLRSFTEKMQWEKIYNNDERKVRLADKYLVRDYVRGKIGEAYLIPLLGTWERYSDIRFEELPESFVLKTNRGSGKIMIVPDKTSLTAEQRNSIRWNIQYANGVDFGTRLCELHYSRIQPKIIAEALIGEPGEDLPDYKFQCFDGQVRYCFVDTERFHGHHRNVYDPEWNLQSWNTGDYSNSEQPIAPPENFDKMLEIAGTLSEGFPQVRVDLYNVKGKIYFGEMTFTAAAGLKKYTSWDADLMLGEMWHADTSQKNRIRPLYMP